ncbi:hypothetical protein LCGC14_0119200 [marine sediment metagenome]|uniref:non-specific protein-tyrosine kinase n=1 Tax=marine sediment metagenome TaxID=412755 RepID=A0A0F9XPI6_9ZZZZ|nr:polysaccharide biosynthesis tyrosine autokinase [Maribacter sp.]HDZ07424.1 polysaccharide biosynthesis tyrosine autokinase [Maribacter sp.]HEA79883.1 polysaccharide biosynthesis tyrosine autokinase [Maribacter sp.]
MTETPFNLDYDQKQDRFDLGEILKKYIKYWPWFAASFLLTLAFAVFYLLSTAKIYESVAKIKIVDNSTDIGLQSNAMSLFTNGSTINLDNQIEILTSYRILSEVVKELQLDVTYYLKGKLKDKQVWDAPFIVVKETSEELKKAQSLSVNFMANDIEVTDSNGNNFTLFYKQSENALKTSPFRILMIDTLQNLNLIGQEYEVVISPIKNTVLGLINKMEIQTTTKDSDVLAISLSGNYPTKSELILNTLIKKFNQDGINDRQQVSKRTLDFIDERFVYLSTELDSIEGGKQAFKTRNNLSYIEADAGVSLERKSETENDVIKLETQISLSALLKNSVVGQAAFELLPVDVGLENSGLNSMVDRYNDQVLQRNKLLQTVGIQHPSLIAISTQLEVAKVNIIKTINIYQTQLRTSLIQSNQAQNKVNSVFSGLPEKEKMLRSIERQQSIKENLFLLLLQKREEAGISLAVTTPLVKIVDYALTSTTPIAPKKTIILGVSGILGLLIPFVFFYIKFSLNDKIGSKSDVLAIESSIPFLGEIPHFKTEKKFIDFNDHSVLAESFRILATNINYMLPKRKDGSGNVIFVTSGYMGEGKSLLAYNLSVAYASINKKVLLIDADLRSPEQHKYFKMDRNTKGLTDYLKEEEINWKSFIFSGLEKSKNHHVCLSGAIPPNAPQLLSNGAFEKFITNAKEYYDLIVVDTAPAVPVTDTLLIADYADVTLFVIRAGVTDKAILHGASEDSHRDKLKNMAYVLNDVHARNIKSYNYGYGEV